MPTLSANTRMLFPSLPLERPRATAPPIIPDGASPLTSPLAAARGPDPDAHAPQAGAVQGGVLQVAEVVVREVVGAVGEDREARRRRPRLGGVPDLDAPRRRAPLDELAHELSHLGCRHPQTVGPPQARG